MNHSLNQHELERYARQIILQELGEAGQTKLKDARVLVVGVGGLGSSLLYYLAASGVGTIGIIDFDTVNLSNLQRQILFSSHDIGKPKVSVAKQKLQAINPYPQINAYFVKIDSTNALEILSQYDIVVDGTDNFSTKYLLNDACFFLKKPLIYGSVLKFTGQVSVFNLKTRNNIFSPNYRDLFPNPPRPEDVPTCNEAGVIGVLPGIIGNFQCNEVFKIITGVGEVIHSKLITFNSLTNQFKTFQYHHDPSNPLSGTSPTIKNLLNYDLVCNEIATSEAKKISIIKFKKLLSENHSSVFLLDVRERSEYLIENIGSYNIPLSELENEVEKIPKNKTVVVHCQSGSRSRKAIDILSKKHGYKNLLELDGNMKEWLAYPLT